jgi:hypothetical protein
LRKAFKQANKQTNFICGNKTIPKAVVKIARNLLGGNKFLRKRKKNFGDAASHFNKVEMYSKKS